MMGEAANHLPHLDKWCRAGPFGSSYVWHLFFFGRFEARASDRPSILRTEATDVGGRCSIFSLGIENKRDLLENLTKFFLAIYCL